MDREKLLRVGVAIEHATGNRPNPSTTWRWTRKGLNGIKLKTVMLGGVPMCKVSWVDQFVQAQTDARSGATV